MEGQFFRVPLYTTYSTMIRLGYVAINTELREQGIYTGRTITLRKLRERGVDELRRLSLANLADLETIVEWNERHGIRLYRVTSNLFPHLDNPLVANVVGDLAFARDRLRQIGDLCRRYGHRITMHPGQYVQLGSPHPGVVANSVLTLRHHAEIFEAMGLTPEMGSGMIIHGGGTFGDKEATLSRWSDTFSSLPADVRRYIILENDEWSWSVDDLLPFCERLGIPFCFDVFHNRISSARVKVTKRLLRRIVATWGRGGRDIAPKIHYSEQDPSLRKGSHSQSVNSLPTWLLHLPTLLGIPGVDIMLEVKDKERSVLRMYDKYFTRRSDDGRVEWVLNEPKS